MQFLNSLAERRFGRTAVVGLELVAIEDGRVVAGGNHDAASGLAHFDRE